MNWICPKCGSAECSTGQFQATGGNFAKFFGVQNKRFTIITCGKCRFTELYQADVSELENIFDFLLG